MFNLDKSEWLQATFTTLIPLSLNSTNFSTITLASIPFLARTLKATLALTPV